MSFFSDSSDEMHNNDLTSEAVERLVNGDYDSPAHTDLAAIVSEMRGLASGVPTPKPGSALSEFVGVGLVINEIPVGTPDAEVDLRSLEGGEIEAPTRRNSVFAQIATFAGTFGGKVAVSGVIAAASVTGAHATGVVDVPGLPDTGAEIETIDTQLIDGNVEFAEQEAPEGLAMKTPGVYVDEVDAFPDAGNFDERLRQEAEQEAKAKAKGEEELKAQAEEEAEKKAEAEAKEKAAAEAEAKKAEEKAQAEKEAAEKKDEKPELSEETLAKLEALEVKVHQDKEAVRAEANVKINAGEAEHEELEIAFEAAIREINEQFEGYITDINAQIEANDNEGEIAELEAYREVKFGLWEDALNEKEIYFGTLFSAVESELEAIELARDAEIERLLNEFRAAVEACQEK
jgi:hypothetical protein